IGPVGCCQAAGDIVIKVQACLFAAGEVRFLAASLRLFADARMVGQGGGNFLAAEGSDVLERKAGKRIEAAERTGGNKGIDPAVDIDAGAQEISGLGCGQLVEYV